MAVLEALSTPQIKMMLVQDSPTYLASNHQLRSTSDFLRWLWRCLTSNKVDVIMHILLANQRTVFIA